MWGDVPKLPQMRIIGLGSIVVTSEQPALETQRQTAPVPVQTGIQPKAGAAGVGEETHADVGSLLDSWSFPARRAPLRNFSYGSSLCACSS